MINKSLEFIRLFLWSIWFGGLTFYAAVVVPIGSDQIGVTTQGMITQQVTIRLNIVGVATVLVWIIGWSISKPRSTALLGLLTGHLIIHCLLVILHVKLTSLLDIETHTVTAQDKFYLWHRAYLLATTAQWLGGLTMIVFLRPRVTGASETADTS